MIGRTLSHYEITAHLGDGGMGEVYRAKDLELGREVALKVLPSHMASNPEKLERFKREARTVASLKHPHIVTIYSVEEDQGVHFLTMELVDGRGLENLLQEEGIDLATFFDIAIPLSEALASAHEHGVIHRDLKPTNVMVDRETGVQILDFGLAKLREMGADDMEISTITTDSLTRDGMIVGTVPYMSPEQAEGKVLDHRSDIFSLGTLLYELVAGHRPFRGETPASLISAILRDHPDALHTVREDVPVQLGRVLNRCLEKDPDKRFQSARDVANELRALRREILSTATYSVGALTPPRPKRKPWTAIVAAVAIVATLGIGWNTLRSRDELPTVVNERIQSLAVLPLNNLSGDPDQEYFADGMTEALITDLSRIGALKVISRTSTMRYKGSELPLPEIAAELGVDGVLEGSVMRDGDRVRITAQLIHAVTDERVWGESYERDLRDILALQSEVARSVASGVEISLTQQEERLLATDRRVDPAAHEAYFRGRHFLNLLTREGFEQALVLMNESVTADPTYAPAWIGIADTYIAFDYWGYRPRDETMAAAQQAINQAMALDDQLGEAWSSQAAIHEASWNWNGADQAYKRSLELSPGLAKAYHAYATMLSKFGQHDRALEYAQKACNLDPKSIEICVDRIFIQQAARRFDEAEASVRTILELNPESAYAQWQLATTQVYLGQLDEAIATYLARPVETAAQNWMLGYAYALSGRMDEAQEVLDFLLERSESRYVPPVQIAALLGAMGQFDRAFEFLDQAAELKQDWGLNMAKVQPFFDPLREDSRFDAVVERLGFPENSGMPPVHP
jgi:serine/threonine protein kinase/tetratricopeptide (TPR) repeat protein